jgi:hypothetical protein
VVLLTGPSDYGLADPIQNTEYCLNLINAIYLKFTFNLKNLISIDTLYDFTKEVGIEAMKIQKVLEYGILEKTKKDKS